jgi:hypothetical protein
MKSSVKEMLKESLSDASIRFKHASKKMKRCQMRENNEMTGLGNGNLLVRS